MKQGDAQTAARIVARIARNEVDKRLVQVGYEFAGMRGRKVSGDVRCNSFAVRLSSRIALSNSASTTNLPRATARALELDGPGSDIGHERPVLAVAVHV